MSLTTDVMDPRARALELLAGLGDTEEEVAANLTAKRIKGWPCSGDSCPVAKYLFAEGITHCGVDTVTLQLLGGWVEVPTAISEFIAGFDAGDYPELIAEVAS